ncbi:MAG: hypothetical protein NUV57_02235 [archaeon]|nr:hypothetical protein [archaeon]
MGLTKNQLGAIFLAIVMFGSVLGLFASQDNTNNSNNIPPEGYVPDVPINQTPTTIAYEVPQIQATVIDLFPTVVLLAKSGDFELSETTSKILAIKEVVSVNNPQFFDDSARNENFRADLRIDSPEAIRTAFESINAIESLTNVQIFPQALVSIPETVEFRNEDLDLTQEYTFTEPQAQAYVTMDTLKGDDLIVSLNASFEGQNLVSLTAFELRNNSSSPQIYFTEDSFPIDSVENEFFVKASADYSKKAVLENAKTILEENNNAETSTIQVSPLSTSINVYFSDANSFFPEDLNFFLSSFDGAVSSSIASDNSFAVVEFNPGTDFGSFKDSLEEGLNSFGFEVDRIEEPKVSLQGTIQAESKEALLASITQTNIDIEPLQKAIIKADSIFILDANTSFSLSSGSFEAFVNLEKIQGETVNLSLVVFANERSGITDVQAQEVAPVQIES